MGTQEYEEQARRKIMQILHPDERIIQEVRAMTAPAAPRGGCNPMLMVATEGRLLTCPIASGRDAAGNTWRQVHDLKIRKKWIAYRMEFTIETHNPVESHSFHFEYDISKKVAGPFLDSVRERWTVHHPDRVVA